MRHRHLVDTDAAARSPTAIDDIIARGLWADWALLRQWCEEEPSLLDDVKRVCGMHVGDPGQQRHRFWLAFVEMRRRADMHPGPGSCRGGDAEPAEIWERFGDVLADLESVAARGRPASPIRSSVDGIETGIWQFVRSQPLETVELNCEGEMVAVPSLAETLRIKAVLILKRNARLDHADFAALAARLGHDGAATAMSSFDALYPQDNGQSATQQLLAQLAGPHPEDLDWGADQGPCTDVAVALFDRLSRPGTELASRPGKMAPGEPEGSDEEEHLPSPSPVEDMTDPFRT